MDITVNIRIDDIILPFIVRVDSKNINEGIEKALQVINEKLNLDHSSKLTTSDIRTVEVIN